MAKKTEKSAPGLAKRRQVSKLKPVVYRMSLIYLGDTRIKPRMDQNPAANTVAAPPYRCRYSLLKHTGADGAELPVAPLTPIPNIVRTAAGTPQDLAAAQFIGAGGTSVNPAADFFYKVMILDNHGTRAAENLILLGNNGDTNSNPEYYRARGWMGDVIPAVPFRIVIRKFVGNKQFDLPAGLKAVAQVKDPAEEFAQTDGRRLNFIEEFFTKYNAVPGTATVGNDNMLERFALSVAAAREPAAADGANATTVLRTLTYKQAPIIDTASSPLAQQEWGETAAATASTRAARAAEFNLELKDETLLDGTKVRTGIVDLCMAPWPAGGDNFRLLIGLFKGDDDVRDTKDEGRSIVLEDDEQQVIPKPRSYTTPRFVLWRKIEFNICVLANNLGEDGIAWDNIIAMYRKAFVEVTRPKNFVRLTRQAWRELLRAQVAQTPTTAPIFANDLHWTDVAHSNSFFPLALQTVPEVTADPRTIIIESAKMAIANAATSLGFPSPLSGDAQTDQRDGHGCAMFLVKDATPVSPLGSYFGDRCFWFQQPGATPSPVDWATSTCAHEFAHLRSIRHSFTDSTRVLEGPGGGGGGVNIQLVNPVSNIYELDHDGRDAWACLQAYLRDLDAQPCGLCALHLRFYDRKILQRDAQLKPNIDDRHGAPVIFELVHDAGTWTLVNRTGATINLAVGGAHMLIAAGPQTNYNTREGTSPIGRLNLSYYRKPGTALFWDNWNKSAPAVDIVGAGDSAFARLEVTAASVGTSIVTYRLNTTSVTTTFVVS